MKELKAKVANVEEDEVVLQNLGLVKLFADRKEEKKNPAGSRAREKLENHELAAKVYYSSTTHGDMAKLR